MEEIRNNAPETESKYLIEVKNLVKWFPIKSSFFKRTIGNVRAVDGISFEGCFCRRDIGHRALEK